MEIRSKLLPWTIWMTVATSGIGFLSGLALAKGKTRRSVWVAISLLWASPLLSQVAGLLVTQFLLGDKYVNAQSSLISGFGRGIFFAAVWTLYLLISKRVKVTYPKRCDVEQSALAGY